MVWAFDLSDINNCYLKGAESDHAAQRQQNVKRIRSKKRNDHKHGRVRRKREESYQISLPAAKAAADKERETAEERYGEQI